VKDKIQGILMMLLR